jgi:hypothetical protein
MSITPRLMPSSESGSTSLTQSRLGECTQAILTHLRHLVMRPPPSWAKRTGSGMSLVGKVALLVGGTSLAVAVPEMMGVALLVVTGSTLVEGVWPAFGGSAKAIVNIDPHKEKFESHTRRESMRHILRDAQPCLLVFALGDRGLIIVGCLPSVLLGTRHVRTLCTE